MKQENIHTSHKRENLYEKMTREAINELPLQRYEGPVSFVQSPKEIPQMVDDLTSDTVLGFDIEIRPAFKKGQSYPPSLLQLAGSKTVYIIQLKKVGLSQKLTSLLESKSLIKTGVSTFFDIKKLQELGTFRPGGFIDLAGPAKEARMKNFGLRGLAALLLGIRIPKGAQRTNWAKKDLSENQIRYAATDAWAGREIYLEMKKKGLINY